jgi:hypothetical protein
MTSPYIPRLHAHKCEVCGSPLEFHGGNNHRWHCLNEECPVQFIIFPSTNGKRRKLEIVYTSMPVREWSNAKRRLKIEVKK